MHLLILALNNLVLVSSWLQSLHKVDQIFSILDVICPIHNFSASDLSELVIPLQVSIVLVNEVSEKEIQENLSNGAIW